MFDDLIVKAATSLDGLLAGVFVGSWMTEHAARSLPARHWIAHNRAKDAVYGPVMPVFFSAGLLLSAAASGVTLRPGLGAATALLLAAGAVTAAVNVPLNREFRTWSCPDHPGDWADGRRRWQRWNAVRCLAAVAAFGVAVFA